MVSAGMKLIKYLLFFFNLIFWITGIGILALGIYMQVKYKHFFVFVGTGFLTGPILLIVVGSIITLIAFFGCCGACKESHCMMITFSVFLGVVFILELAAGIAAYVMRKDLEKEINKNMNEAVMKYGQPDYKKFTEGIDVVQHESSCCGFNSSTDWALHGQLIPKSCCKEDSDACDTTKQDNIYTEGCYKKFLNKAESNIGIVGGVGVGIAFVQIVGIVCACCLASAIKREYEVV